MYNYFTNERVRVAPTIRVAPEQADVFVRPLGAIRISEKEHSMWYQSLSFWKAVSLVIAVGVGLFSDYKIEAVAVEGLILAVLNLMGINPEAMGLRR